VASSERDDRTLLRFGIIGAVIAALCCFTPLLLLLLGAVGAWAGWQLALWTAWWAALVGAVLAFVLWRRGQRIFAYVPAIAIGFALAALDVSTGEFLATREAIRPHAAEKDNHSPGIARFPVR